MTRFYFGLCKLSSKDMWWQTFWKVGGPLSAFANDKKYDGAFSPGVLFPSG
jgi:hypothetical protein